MRTTFTPERRRCVRCGASFVAERRNVVRCSDECGLAALAEESKSRWRVNVLAATVRRTVARRTAKMAREASSTSTRTDGGKSLPRMGSASVHVANNATGRLSA